MISTGRTEWKQLICAHAAKSQTSQPQGAATKATLVYFIERPLVRATQHGHISGRPSGQELEVDSRARITATKAAVAVNRLV